jgi:hypothetical protein
MTKERESGPCGCHGGSRTGHSYGGAGVNVSLALDGLVTEGLAGVVGYLWPQTMSWAREQILPWIEHNIPGLASAVRLAFQDLDEVMDDLRRTVRAAWHSLRIALVSQTAQFVGLADGAWVIRFISCLRDLERSGKHVVYVISEQELDWESQPTEIRAAALANGLHGTWIDIVRARDRLLAPTALGQGSS